MDCPHSHSARTTRLQRTTDLGYAVFHCQDCGRSFNERTGTSFNFLEVLTDSGFQVRFCRLRYTLSYRKTAEVLLLRGFDFTHQAVPDWRSGLRRRLLISCGPSGKRKWARSQACAGVLLCQPD